MLTFSTRHVLERNNINHAAKFLAQTDFFFQIQPIFENVCSLRGSPNTRHEQSENFQY